MMNSLTVNLHLFFVSFYRPTAQRYKILIEEPQFPSDNYAVRTHLTSRGIDPDDALIIAKPRAGEHLVRTQDVEAILAERGSEIALVWIGGVNFLTGQVFDIPMITAEAKRAGCTVGWDLAHAAGNVVLNLHDWDVDFAAWCSYKYLNAGPGAIAGAFVHERHGNNPNLPRYAGWWGNDPETRFRMQLQPEFVPRAGADGWQISNPPILAMAPLQASLELFDRATMPALRTKSISLTAYLRSLLERIKGYGKSFDIITPREIDDCGCQLSIVVHEHARDVLAKLEQPARRAISASRTSSVPPRHRCTTRSTRPGGSVTSSPSVFRNKLAPRMTKQIAIVGAGLAGPLLACYLARDGFDVTLFERRGDPRIAGFTGGRSINLALSARGIDALQRIGLADEVAQIGHPHARPHAPRAGWHAGVSSTTAQTTPMRSTPSPARAEPDPRERGGEVLKREDVLRSPLPVG
jgi:kynureninase